MTKISTFYWFLIFLLLSACIFGVTVHNPYYFDDLYVLKNNAWLHGLKPPGYWFTSFYVDSNHLFPGYRPLLMLSFYIDHLLSNGNGAYSRVVNIALHVSNALLFSTFIKSKITDEKTRWLAWVAGLLFLLHPAQTLPINFIWKRSTLLETFFILIQLHIHKHARQKNTYPLNLIALQVFLFACSLLVKESALLIPFFLLAYDLFFTNLKKFWTSKRAWGVYVLFFVVSAFFYWFRFTYVDQQIAQNRTSLIPNWHILDFKTYVITSITILPQYVGLWLVPNPLVLNDPRPVTEFPWWEFFNLLLFIALSILLSIRFWKNKLIPFSISIFWISILPTAFHPLFLPMDQIRLYFPLAGLSVLTAYAFCGICNLVQKKWFQAQMVLFLLMTTYAFHTFEQNMRYANQMLIWEDVVHEYEQSDIAWGELGSALAGSKLYSSAAIAFLMATRVEARNAGYSILTYHNMLRAGVPEKLVRPWLTSSLIEHLSTPDTVNLATLLRELNELEAAKFLLNHLLTKNQNFPPAHLQLGAIYEEQKEFKKAQEQYKKVLELYPQNTDAQRGLSRIKPHLKTDNQ